MRSFFRASLIFAASFVVTVSLFLAVGLAGAAAADDKKVSPAAAPLKAPAADTPSCRCKVIYRIARDHAVKQYARDKGLSLKEARDKAEHIDDSTIHAAVVAGGIQFADLPAGGSDLDNFLKWVVAHQDQIVEVIKVILTLMALFG